MVKQYVPDEVIAVQDVSGAYHVRSGGCTIGCGACCEFLILPLDPRMRQADPERLEDFIYWAGLHGVTIMESGDWWAARIPLRCEKLVEDADGDKTCGVFGEPERPKLCVRYPRHPLDLEGVAEVCTYRFDSTPDRPKAYELFLLRQVQHREEAAAHDA